MHCPHCHARLDLKYTYSILGKRYGYLPGVARVYHCSTCNQDVRSLEIHTDRLNEWAHQWEERRQEWIKEKAKLDQRIYWLSLPADHAEKRLQELRRSLIGLIERTF